MKLNLDNFKAPDLTEWRSKIMTETGSNEKHIYHNKVEGIQIDTTDKTNSLNFESDFKNIPNDWNIGAFHNLTDAIETNHFLLKCLSHGANELNLNIQIADPEQGKDVFHSIKSMADYIQVNS